MCATENIAFITATLVLISEILPFIKSRSNGILHFCYLCMHSECIKKETLKEQEIEEKPKNVEMIDVSLSSDSSSDATEDY